MRVISGKFGSRRISSAQGMAVRPTSDRLRETLFDILQSRIEGCFFVDGYAGTGAVGIEAASRGARRVVFLEKHRPTVALIRENLETLGITEGVEVLPGDVCRGLETLKANSNSSGPVDIFFFDPPYEEKEEYERVMESLADSPLVAPQTQIIFERTRKLTLLSEYGPLTRVRTVIQGDAALDFFSRV
ncbi:MAG TPA: 16S rRNA (guanine(966)-N(2))-methyltransferase RsmD [Candidatus Acidoferrales bacterium]|nr:16S rRNA (guanine(966)-N(2))-methyltransferase RsmD [Candidatus Acidoferrales bacterium]